MFDRIVRRRSEEVFQAERCSNQFSRVVLFGHTKYSGDVSSYFHSVDPTMQVLLQVHDTVAN